MHHSFNIIQSSTSFDIRPPISYKVREYLESFIVDNLLKKKKILIKSKWKIELSLTFCQESARYKSINIFMPKTPITVKEEGVKIYEVLIPMKLITKSTNPYLKTIELMYESISIFFTTTYKKITKDLMNELWEDVNIHYLLSLPYPAALIEQKYLEDTITKDGTVKSIIEWTDVQSR